MLKDERKPEWRADRADEDYMPNDEAWSAMDEAQRVATVRAGNASMRQLAYGLEEGSAALKEACREREQLAQKGTTVGGTIKFWRMRDKDARYFWEKMTDAERAAWVRDERTPMTPALLEAGMLSESEELRVACKEAFQALLGDGFEGIRAGYVYFALSALPKLKINKTSSWVDIINAIRRARPKWNIRYETPLVAISELLRREIETQREQRNFPKRHNALPLAQTGLIRAPADRINKATIEALMTGAMRKRIEIQTALAQLEARGLTEGNQVWAAYPIETRGNDLHGAIVLTKDPGEAVWNLLQKNGALAVKAQYALWARAYAETDADPNRFITLPINQFCDDLGFKKKKRAHTRENKQAARRVLELLTSVELIAVFQPPHGAARRLRGPIWSRGILAEESDSYADLFGANRVPGTKASWDPVAFSYAPGPFFVDDAWRKYNHNVALIGEGLLKLGADNADKYAVMVGGYLAILARMNGYRRTVVGVHLLLKKTGLWSVNAETNPGRMRDKLERALERLKEVGVIRKSEITSPPEGINPDDLTSTETLDALAEPTQWKKRWINQCVLVDWPEHMELRREVLEVRRTKAIANKRERKSRPSSSADVEGS